jgi:phosphate transport system protein
MKLDNEIEHLTQMIIKMAEVVVDNLKIAVDLYHEYDEDKALLINDDVVDLHERLIEEMCLTIMLRERPYASDLRKVSGILKLVSDLERLGDHAEDLRDFAKKLQKVEHHNCLLLNESTTKAFSMVEDAVTSFVNNDIELAQNVISRDDEIDMLYDKSVDRIIQHLDDKDYSNAFAVYTTLVVKYIERIADHAVNIAEWVVYILSGYHKDKQIF